MNNYCQKLRLLCMLLCIAQSFLVVNAGSLSGSAVITPQDYYGLPAKALANNPPACGMPYNQLNLALITAVEKMDTSSTCNQCLKVVNTRKPSVFIYVLAVDLGGSGLDLSIPAFNYLFNQSYDASPASWSTVDSSYCEGIYTPGKVNTRQGIAATVGVISSKTSTRSSTTQVSKTTTVSVTSSTKKIRSSTNKVSKTTTTSNKRTSTTKTRRSSTVVNKRRTKRKFKPATTFNDKKRRKQHGRHNLNDLWI
ncbi:hypothetical protein BDF20DRAFT_145052 [Mycotypha africana]|uniref:uncharacterized protein n=1 Tax=Mycotypha africana TaxID=64632 RepID=UPI0023012C50|nr:uncharacterized protein BDF20DRAFT_145052 [Mycotypha africana]KAI8969105.1 hypothetical protein BDF20DRAFT_145052 [Mycotypha africana]